MKLVFLSNSSSMSRISTGDSEVLSFSDTSFTRSSLMIDKVSSIGTLVYRDVTSNDHCFVIFNLNVTYEI